MISPSVLAVLLAIFGKSFDAYWLFNVSWVLIAVSYLALFFYPFMGMLLYRHSLKKCSLLRLPTYWSGTLER